MNKNNIPEGYISFDIYLSLEQCKNCLALASLNQLDKIITLGRIKMLIEIMQKSPNIELHKQTIESGTIFYNEMYNDLQKIYNQAKSEMSNEISTTE